MSIALLMNAPINVKFTESAFTQKVLNPDLLSALVGDFYEDWTGGTEGLLLELDASLREDHQLEADSSENPIEDGSLVTDNYLKRPRRLMIEGTVTDTPVQYLSALTTGEQGLGSLASWTGIMPARINAWTALKAMWESGVPFDVSTGLDLYKNMVIKRVSAPTSAMIGRQLLFTAELEQKLILTKESAVPSNDLAANMDELGYITSQIPDAVSIAAAALFVGLIIYGYAS